MGNRPTVRTDMRSRLEFVDQPGGNIELQILHGVEQEWAKRRAIHERAEAKKRESAASSTTGRRYRASDFPWG